MNDNLSCGHCCRTLDLCDCGVDQDVCYRSQNARLWNREPSFRDKVRRLAAIGAVCALGELVALLWWFS